MVSQMQTKLPYLMQNRFEIYLLRFSFPKQRLKPTRTGAVRVQVKNKSLAYRQVVCSLGTSDKKHAIKMYFSVIENAKSLHNQAIHELPDMTNEEYEQIISAFKIDLATLIETSRSKDNPRWLADIHKRKLINSLESTIAPCEQETTPSGAHSAKFEAKSSPSSPACTKRPERAPTSPNRSTIQDEVIDYITFKEKGWAQRTKPQAIAVLNRFAQIVGQDKDVSELNSYDVQHYMKVMKSLPRNAANKKPSDFDALSADNKRDFWLKLCDTDTRTLTLGGVEKHASEVRGLLKRLFEYRRLEHNLVPFTLIDRKSLKRSAENVGDYPKAELVKIFTSYIYSSNLRFKERPKPMHFWVPLIALTTGMRAGEIAALEVADIAQVEGVKCFRLNTRWSDSELRKSGIEKSKKNDNAIRDIPIPEVVLNAGFDVFIGDRKHGLLFEELRDSFKINLSKEVSKWYLDFFRKYAGLSKENEHGEKLVFHSFRHTFITQIHRTYVGESLVKGEIGDYLSGHSDGSVRKAVYMHGHDMVYAKKCIDSIDFGVDFSKLSYCEFLKRS